VSRLYERDDDWESWMDGQRAGALRSAIQGRRGQRFLQDLINALDALPEPELSAGALEDEETGCCCAFGAVRRFRGAESVPLYFHPMEEDVTSDKLAKPFDVSRALAWEVVEANEGWCKSNSPGARRQRFKEVRRWAVGALLAPRSRGVLPRSRGAADGSRGSLHPISLTQPQDHQSWPEP
jgi:hypothetical protein